MSDTLAAKLAQLIGSNCVAVEAVEFETPPSRSIYATGTRIHFADRTILSTQFWRLIKSPRPLVSIFDHRQQYGLPAPIDAISDLRGELVGKAVTRASISETTGDLCFELVGHLVLEVFDFTAFEIWDVVFPDGTANYSNHVLD